ncbi:MFS transporter [Leptospira interrogans]
MNVVQPPPQSTRDNTILLLLLSLSCFAGALSLRTIDPVVPEIGRDLSVAATTVALLASAFAFPYAFSQPVLGPIADAVGKARVMKVCLFALTVMMMLSALAPNIETLFITRIIAGVAAGGIIPVALAMVGDRFDFADRQVALSRIIMAAMMGQLVSSMGAGFIASVFSWRVAMAVIGGVSLVAFIALMLRLRPRPQAERRKFTLANSRSGYAAIFANPKAKFCYLAVFVEGLMIMGMLPYVATLLEARGAGGIREAGIVVAGIGIGGVLFSFLIRILMKQAGGMFNLIRLGGFTAAAGYLIFSLQGAWQSELIAFVIVGVGFFMIHNPLQTQATELAPSARGSAVALHAFFFFVGHAFGPIYYGLGFSLLGVTPMILISAATMVGLALFTAHNLERLSRAKD